MKKKIRNFAGFQRPSARLRTGFMMFLLAISNLLSAIDFNLKNNINLKSRIFSDSQQEYHASANYRPDLFVTIFGNDRFSIDTEQTLELYYDFRKSDDRENDEFDLNLYRSWFRFSATQYEVRIGRQKLNFGPAQILRPLKWFDTIDPTDPQKNSQGTDALLFRYYFLNNANFWFWTIDPDNTFQEDNFYQKTDGYEFGGRFQYPFQYCEAAITYHHRNLFWNVETPHKFDDEDRFGLDCRWDFQIGLWIEIMYSKLSNADSTMYSHFFTVGADYTVGIGNGLYILTEHMFYENSYGDFPTLFQNSSASSCLLTYPIGLFDSVSAMINYDWITENFFYYASYSRNYDLISFYLNFFWNPAYNEYPIPGYNQDGKSVQLIIEINF